MSNRVLAGIDIGGTKCAVSLSLEPPHAVSREEFPTEQGRGPELAIERIFAILKKMLSRQGVAGADLRAIGISCGGPLDSVHGVIQSPPNLQTWNAVPICQLLENEFGVPCYLENDANAGALAEARFGAGRGVDNLVFLTLGTGLGAGLILDGRLRRGASQSAGEIGHVRLSESGPEGHGKTGSAEGWASGGGMAQIARMYALDALARGEHTALAVGGEVSDVITARQVGDAARAGDPVAKAVVRTVGDKLGEVMSILIDVLNPECIILGGLALRFGDDLLRPAREVVAREALENSAKACRIVPAALGEQIGDVAALCAALEGLSRHADTSIADQLHQGWVA